MLWVLFAFAVIWSLVGLATVLAVRARRRHAPRMWDPRRRFDSMPARPDRFDHVHKQLAHYRASGALPRWDP